MFPPPSCGHVSLLKTGFVPFYHTLALLHSRYFRQATEGAPCARHCVGTFHYLSFHHHDSWELDIITLVLQMEKLEI